MTPNEIFLTHPTPFTRLNEKRLSLEARSKECLEEGKRLKKEASQIKSFLKRKLKGGY